MKPIDYRSETWKDIQDRLDGLRYVVYHAWQTHGPGTTREVAERAAIDILTFRPRTTELFQLGLLEISEEQTGKEGVYQAVGMDRAMSDFIARKEQLTQNPAQIPLL
jgi:hypothetical protein